MAPPSGDDGGRIPPELGVSREFDMSTPTWWRSDVDSTQFHPRMSLLILGICGQPDHQLGPFSLANQQSEEDERCMDTSGMPSAEPQQSVNDEAQTPGLQPRRGGRPLLRYPLDQLAHRQPASVKHCFDEVGPNPDEKKGFRHEGKLLFLTVAVFALHSSGPCGALAQPLEVIT